MNNNFNFIKTPEEINFGIAKRVRFLRKADKLTQKELSEKSGVSLGSIKRFERTGEISLKSLVKISIVLDVSNELTSLFAKKKINSIEEIINGQD